MNPRKAKRSCSQVAARMASNPSFRLTCARLRWRPQVYSIVRPLEWSPVCGTYLESHWL